MHNTIFSSGAGKYGNYRLYIVKHILINDKPYMDFWQTQLQKVFVIPFYLWYKYFIILKSLYIIESLARIKV